MRLAGASSTYYQVLKNQVGKTQFVPLSSFLEETGASSTGPSGAGGAGQEGDQTEVVTVPSALSRALRLPGSLVSPKGCVGAGLRGEARDQRVPRPGGGGRWAGRSRRGSRGQGDIRETLLPQSLWPALPAELCPESRGGQRSGRPSSVGRLS